MTDTKTFSRESERTHPHGPRNVMMACTWLNKYILVCTHAKVSILEHTLAGMWIRYSWASESTDIYFD